MFICIFCSNEFSSRQSLLGHQKRTKYCKDLQEKHIMETTCKLCDNKFKFRTKEDQLSHENICSMNKQIMDLKSILLEKDKKILDLEKQCIEFKIRLEERTKNGEEFKALHAKTDECIKKIALQPKITTKNTSNSTQNNILNNLPIFNLTKEKLQLIASTEFTHELFLRGQEGAAKFATNIARKENDGDLPWVVSDKNRGIVKMKGEDGIIITDYDVEIITELVFEAIKDKNQEYFDAAYPPYDSDAEELDPDEAERVEANKARADKCFSDIAKMRRNNKVFKKKLIEYSL